MTNEERDIIARFVARLGGHAAAPGFTGSVPATQAAPALPPIDPEADQFIAALFNQYPEARYRITQTAFVQEAALNEAKSRIERLQWEVQQAQQQLAQAQQAAQQQAQPQQRSGILGGLFGGAPRPQPQPPQPQYAPQPQPPQYSQYAPQPQMFQQQGNGFLGGALRTAAGVAGGVMLADAITGLFEGHHGYGGFGGGGLGGGSFGGGETVINNYYDDQGQGGQAAQPDPWGGAGASIDNSGTDNWSSQPDNGGFDNGTGDDGNFDSGDQGGDFGSDSGGDSGGDWGN